MEKAFSSAFAQLAGALAGAMDTWLALTVLVALIVVAVFRADRILDARSFRSAVRRFGFYLVLPVLIAVLGGAAPQPDAAVFFTSLSVIVGRLLLALTIMSLLRSLLPAREPT